MITATTILLIAALICFIADTVGASTRINLMAAGLACATGAVLVGGVAFGCSGEH